MTTTIQTLNEQVKSILGNRYEATNNGKFEIRFAGYKIAPSHLLSEVERKAGQATKKEIAKLCLMIALGK